MNKQLIREVAEVIERREIDGLYFDMTSFYKENPCGTTACIAGWTIAHVCNTAKLQFLAEDMKNVSAIAGDLLGLTSCERSELFFAYGRKGHTLTERSIGITAAEAAKTLRHLAETGEVKWFV